MTAVVYLTCHVRLVGRSSDGDIAVLDSDQVFAGAERGVRELIALVQFLAGQSRLGRPVNEHRQETTASARCLHEELVLYT